MFHSILSKIKKKDFQIVWKTELYIHSTNTSATKFLRAIKVSLYTCFVVILVNTLSLLSKKQHYLQKCYRKHV